MLPGPLATVTGVAGDVAALKVALAAVEAVMECRPRASVVVVMVATPLPMVPVPPAVLPARTTTFISHPVSTVRKADRIAVLHAGRIVELGTHDELLARNGYYSDLYNKQLLEEELAEV